MRTVGRIGSIPILSGLIWATLSLPLPAADDGFVDLIDPSLTAWKTTGKWVVDDQNVLRLDPTPSGFRLFPDVKKFLWLREPQSDFILELEYRLAEDSRSGVFIRTSSVSQYMEIQLCNPVATEDASKAAAKLTDADCGALVDHAPPSCVASKPAGQWNSMRIDCRGDDLIVDINGQNVLKFDLSHDESLKKMKHGMIALQNQSLPVSFRNVRLKSIPVSLNDTSSR